MYEFAPKVVSFATGQNVPVFDEEVNDYIRKKETFVKNGSVAYGRVLNDTCAITLARRG